MKQLRTKVILSAFVLIFALVATIGSTFAWFTVATTVNVSSMQLNVQSQDSLLIRLADENGLIKNVPGDNNLFDATQYKTTLTTADILKYYPFDGRDNTDEVPVADPAEAWRLEPVTVVNATYTGVNGKAMSTLASGSNVTRALSATDGDDINSKLGKFIEIKFYLFSQGTSTQAIVLQDLSIVAAGSGVAVQVEDAVRLSVWRAGHFVLGDGLTLTSAGAASVFGYTKDYGFVFTSANPTYFHGTGETPAAIYNGSNVLQGFNKISDLTQGYDGVSTAPTPLTWNGTYYNLLAARDGGTATKSAATEVFSLNSNEPTLVTVRIFVEGWAANTTNNIIASGFSISYKFSIKAIV